MTIPSLPTDNLYKFISIFGLIFTLFIIYQEDEFILKIDQEINQLEADANKYRLQSIKLEFLESQFNQIEYSHRDSLKYLQYLKFDSLLCNVSISKLATDPEYKALVDFALSNKNSFLPYQTNNKFTTLHTDFDSLQIRLKIMNAKVDQKGVSIKRKIKERQSRKTGFLINLLVGILLVVIGFNAWYFKVQKPMDEALLKKLKEDTSVPD